MPALLRRTSLPFFTLIIALVLAACASDAGSETEPTEVSESASETDMSSEDMESMSESEGAAAEPSEGAAAEPSEGAAAEPSEGGVALNEADVTFLQMMIPHHEQANEMAEMVEGATERPELAELAATILSTQTAEIEQMNGLLEAAGEDAGMGGMDMSSMPGMMDEAQMAELMQLRDVAFDLAFIDRMTEHHSGAIEMSETVIADGENPEVVQLAQEIIDAQQTEIDQMAEWRSAWS